MGGLSYGGLPPPIPVKQPIGRRSRQVEGFEGPPGGAIRRRRRITARRSARAPGPPRARARAARRTPRDRAASAAARPKPAPRTRGTTRPSRAGGPVSKPAGGGRRRSCVSPETCRTQASRSKRTPRPPDRRRQRAAAFRLTRAALRRERGARLGHECAEGRCEPDHTWPLPEPRAATTRSQMSCAISLRQTPARRWRKSGFWPALASMRSMKASP